MMIRTDRWFLPPLLVMVLSLAWAQSQPGEARTILGGSYTLAAGDVVSGDLTAIGAEVTLLTGSRLDGHVTSIGGKLIISGTVTQDVRAYGGEVVLLDNARVSGSVSTTWATLEQAPGASVGQVQLGASRAISFRLPAISQQGANLYSQAAQAESPLDLVLRSFGLALLAALLALLAPRPLRRVGETMVARPVHAVSVGVTAAIIAVMVLVLLVITLVGIPLALAGTLLIVAITLFGWAALGAQLGRFMAGHLGNAQGWPELAAVTAGSFVLALVTLSLTGAPVVGGLVQAVLSCLALGAAALTRFGTQAYRTNTPARMSPDPRAHA